MSAVIDITPEHHPLGLLRAATEEAEENKYVTVFILMVREDGSMWRDGCAYKKSDLLWALEKEKQRLMG